MSKLYTTASSTTSQHLTGWTGDADYFVFRKYQEFTPPAVVDVLRGKVPGITFRGMVKPAPVQCWPFGSGTAQPAEVP